MSALTEALAREIRIDSVSMVHRARASHIGSSLSVADILAVLYGTVMRHRPMEPAWPERDILLLSKGHAAAAGYAALARVGYFDAGLLHRFQEDGSALAGHLTKSSEAPGVEWSTGSLGHGLPVGVGMALWRSRTGAPSRVFVVMSDGECDEGTTWESALLASHHRLSNLSVIVDANGIQSFGKVSEVLDLEPLAEKWAAFGWAVAEVDGHDHGMLEAALDARAQDRPSVVIARTVKGQGVSFMQGDLLWHYRNPSDDELDLALKELGAR
jgi:transketolase